MLSTMMLLSRGERFEPAVSRSRWMSAVWVQMCFCLLFLGDFHSALSRAHSPGQGAPLLPLCGGETWQMYLDMSHSGAAETGWDSLPLSLLGLWTWNMSLTNISIPTKKNSVWSWLHWHCSFACITSFRLVNKASHAADLTAYPYCIFREWTALKALDAVMDTYRWML